MNDIAFVAIFPFVFVGLWLTIGAFIAVIGGWTGLALKFPDRMEEPLQRLRFRSGRLGNGSIWNPFGGVSYNSCLHFDLCRSGLRVVISRLFSPFSRPIFVPWEQISVKEKQFLFIRTYRLMFGNDEQCPLTIYRPTFKWIAASGLLKLGVVC